jgi:hypothetical protein
MREENGCTLSILCNVSEHRCQMVVYSLLPGPAIRRGISLRIGEPDSTKALRIQVFGGWELLALDHEADGESLFRNADIFSIVVVVRMWVCYGRLSIRAPNVMRPFWSKP